MYFFTSCSAIPYLVCQWVNKKKSGLIISCSCFHLLGTNFCWASLSLIPHHLFIEHLLCTYAWEHLWGTDFQQRWFLLLVELTHIPNLSFRSLEPLQGTYYCSFPILIQSFRKICLGHHMKKESKEFPLRFALGLWPMLQTESVPPN